MTTPEERSYVNEPPRWRHDGEWWVPERNFDRAEAEIERLREAGIRQVMRRLGIDHEAAAGVFEADLAVCDVR